MVKQEMEKALSLLQQLRIEEERLNYFQNGDQERRYQIIVPYGGVSALESAGKQERDMMRSLAIGISQIRIASIQMTLRQMGVEF
ncbi:MAG: hypothetical protein IH612_04865 [Desulfofustis sp.]|nr:hypothetical protein [Desulfofustis sp.]